MSALASLAAAAAVALLVAAPLAAAQGLDTSFLLLSPDALANTSYPDDNFGSEDKLIPCNDGTQSFLVFVDLDNKVSFGTTGSAMKLNHCGTSPAARQVQTWQYNQTLGMGGASSSTFYLRNPPPYYWADPGTCLDVASYSTDVNATIRANICRDITDPKHFNQRWNYTTNRVVSDDGGGKCLRAGFPGSPDGFEAPITTAVCDDNDAAQDFVFNPLTGKIQHAAQVGGTWCVDAGTVGRVIRYDGQEWVDSRITSIACPDAGNNPLLPRQVVSGYSVGVVSMNAHDRLMIVGGDGGESNNIYFSDDCGISWNCYDGDQPWTTYGRSYSAIVTLPIPSLVFAPGGIAMGGGIIYNSDGSTEANSDIFYATDGGNSTWLQTDAAPFSFSAGELAADRLNLYVWSGNGPFDRVLVASAAAISEGYTNVFKELQNDPFNSFGRRVFISGRVTGGCWFSTDFTSAQLWGLDPGSDPVESSNLYSIAQTANGPWSNPRPAPWAPRVGAAVVAFEDGEGVFFGGGLDFVAGLPTGVTFGDVWAVDAAVCLRNDAGTVCSGHGSADLDSVTCNCVEGWTGPICDQPTDNTPSTTPSPTPTPGGDSASPTPTNDALVLSMSSTPTPTNDVLVLSMSSTPTPTNDALVLSMSSTSTPSPTHTRTRRVTVTLTPAPTPVAGAGVSTAVVAAAVSVSVVFAGILGLFVFLRVSGTTLGALVARVTGSGGGGGGGKASYAAVSSAINTSTWRASSAGGAGSDTARAAAERLGATKAPDLPKGTERVSLLRGGAKAPVYSAT